MRSLDCSSPQKLMSPFIDSMVTRVEAEDLELHVAVCQPCRRQLQSYKSMRSLLAVIDKPAVPEDMVLETRVKLSKARNKNVFVRLENRLGYWLKPIVVPAFFGVSLTMLFFGILLGSFASDSTVLAQDRPNEEPFVGFYEPVRTTDPTMIRFTSRTKAISARPRGRRWRTPEERAAKWKSVLAVADDRPLTAKFIRETLRPRSSCSRLRRSSPRRRHLEDR